VSSVMRRDRLLAVFAVVWLVAVSVINASNLTIRPVPEALGTSYVAPEFTYDASASRAHGAAPSLSHVVLPTAPVRGGSQTANVASALSRGFGVAAKSADEFVDLASASRRSHILDGHRYGGVAGNTWFPKGWSDDKIMNSVSDIATDPSLTWVQQTGRAGAAVTRGGAPVRYTVEGVSDGVKIRVVLQPGGEGIITGFPIP